MRWLVTLPLVLFIGIMVVVWIASERAQPAFIDVDPATAHAAHR